MESLEYKKGELYFRERQLLMWYNVQDGKKDIKMINWIKCRISTLRADIVTLKKQ